MSKRLVASAIAVWTALPLLSAPLEARQNAPEVSLVGTAHVRIGTVEGRPETVFAGVVGAVRLPDGRIAIADGGNHVIRVFDASGTHVRSIGRQGEGPGEFEGLSWLGLCGTEELLAVDAILGRAMVLSSDDGRLMRTVATPSWLRFNEVLSCERDGRMIALLNRPNELGTRGRVTRFPATVVGFEPGTEERQVLLELSGTEYYFASNVGGYSPLPLGAQAHAASNEQRVYAGQNDEASIHVIDPRTGRRSTFEHGLPASAVSTTAWESAKAEVIAQAPLARTRRLLEQVLDEAPVPERHPRFLDMKVDRDGRLWLRPPSSTSETVWRVLDDRGHHVGSVSLPASQEPIDIGVDYLVALDRDALGVQSIVAYSFARRLLRFQSQH